MIYRHIFWWCFLIISFPTLTLAQVYQLDQSVSVKRLDKTLFKFPWVGGLNSSQYSTLDVNGDKVEDLMVFERTSGKIHIFINENDNYTYAPYYASLFPEDIRSWILLRDFNCDGLKDIFTSDPLGIRVYTNVSDDEGLKWRLFNDRGPQSPLLTKGFSDIPLNLQMNASDIPSITDVDGDGDLDVLSFRFSGASTVEFHKNLSMERTGTCDSLQLERDTQAWGDFEQCLCDDIALNGADCAPIGGRIQHQGGKALLTLDLDNDGDHDAVLGEETCFGLAAVFNGGTASNAEMVSVSVNFPNSTNPALPIMFPASYFEDLDFDGIKDILVSPNVPANIGSSIDFANSNWFYKNTGTNTNPDFQFIQRDFLQGEMLDFGENAAPTFFDYDGDGDLDLFIGNNSDPTQGFRSTLRLFENTGRADAPSFELINEDFLFLSALNYRNLKPNFADLNNDGRTDLVFSATSLSSGTTSLLYLLNRSETGLDLDLNQGIGFLFSIGSGLIGENVNVIDIDKDGEKDLLIGRGTGRLEYYRNAGTFESPNFILEDQTFYNREVSPFTIDASVDFGDLDGDGTLDMVIGDGRGNLNYYADFLSNLENPLDGVPLVIQEQEGQEPTLLNFGTKLIPRVANIFNEDKPAVVLGTGQGGLVLLRNTGASLEPLPGETVRIFPNPVINKDVVTIVSRANVSAFVVSLTGQVVMENISLQAEQQNRLSIKQLSDGLYILVTSDGGSFRFIVDK
ncbi:T9SS type A sorting domain-containing protein [Fulvivirga sp. M361]|uniref:FG-GAP-like repeat-containing protein n=1 Tax=Fulvivirga sp. M361 TaxID=2594266 RepID=UPI00117A93DC|nr:FG-GAP-like repeat-containing protein [Fulvivirga sp. M361]TRX51627.1 T9SS type A sorting domain-containing protein [Fulvivirga sp. M361]